MNELEATGVLVLLFALRCALPALLMFGLGYLMNWWVDRSRQQDVILQKPKSDYCATHTQCGNRCWFVRWAQEGSLPTTCVNCPIYKQAVHAV